MYIMKRSKISARSNNENKILIPTFTLNEHPTFTIDDAKKLIEDDIFEYLKKDMERSLNNLWRVGDEEKKQTRKRRSK
jgi:hypothetical protein